MMISGNRADEELFITLFALQSILILEGVDSMPAYKDPTTGTWFVKFYSKDWNVVLKPKKMLLNLKEISK